MAYIIGTVTLAILVVWMLYMQFKNFDDIRMYKNNTERLKR